MRGSPQSIIRRFSPKRFSWRHVLLDAALLLISLYTSLYLRLGEERLHEHVDVLNKVALAFVAIRILVLIGAGVYQALWRYISANDATRLALANLVSVPLLVSFTYFFPEWYLPRSLFIIDWLVSTLLLMGARLLRRHLFERQMRPQKSQVSLGKLLIYGAGQNGRLLAQRLLSDPSRDRDLLGFLDDNPEMSGKVIAGLPVLGNRKDLEAVAQSAQCTELVVAITNPSPDLMRDLVMLGRKLNVRVYRIAHYDDPQGARGEALYKQIELKDLLHRPSTQIDLPSLKSLMNGKVVLVTGAGGSIGSELCRQIARLGPSKLLLLDHSEFNLYEIDRELRPATQTLDRIVPVLVDIKDQHSLESVFTTHKPQVVFHAAAYKHVHLVEANVSSAVLNNVQGTWNLLRLCEKYQTERFVMVSTDKAVNPVGAMGATKRVCELLTLHYGQKLNRPFSSVRFGNVLGSSGSLIPLLSKQIEDGGPVTLTHPDMTRYFMLIPEAVALVLMSATLSKPGDINVLKMGEPIKILDLAKSLMALLGKSEDEVAIAFTGIRPGEKMFEELYLTGDELTTRHADILTVPHQEQRATVVDEIDRLVQMAEKNQSGTLSELLKLANRQPRGDHELASDHRTSVTHNT